MKMRKSEGAEFVKWLPHLLDALRALDGAAKPKEVSNWIAKKLKLSPDVTEATMKSGILRFHNQVQWARQYLVWEGLVGSSKYGIWNLTEQGETTHLSDREAREIFLKWVRIHAGRRNEKSKEDSPLVAITEPIDYQRLPDPESEFRATLLATLRSLHPQGFERFITQLLLEMGFERAENTPFTCDGGIDGYGLMRVSEFIWYRVVYQCKRYAEKPVSRSEVGDFRNAMLGRADKGIIFTTSRFSPDAMTEAEREGVPPIELVDGERLIGIIERLEFGVVPVKTFVVDEAFMSRFMPNNLFHRTAKKRGR
jgi:restriction system protein